MPKSKLQRLLESAIPWPEELNYEELQTRVHDDHDGTNEGILIIEFNKYGDAYISTDKHVGNALRFRTESGGGKSLRTRNALVILALAIHLDNEEEKKRAEMWKGEKIKKVSSK